MLGAVRHRRVHAAPAILAAALALLPACETILPTKAAAPTERPAAAAPRTEAPAGVGIAVAEQATPGAAGRQQPPGPALKQAEFFRGTGAVVGAPAAERRGIALGEGGAVTLNFANADLREVVNAVLGQTLGLNFILDPRVQGTITVRTSAPLQRDQVIPALESVLALNGAALELSGGVYRVVPLEEAAMRPKTPFVGTSNGQLGAGFGIQVIPLRYVGAASLLEVLQPFAGPGRVLQADRDRNLVIYAGTGPEARDLVEMVRVFDVDWMAGMSFALLPLSVADPKSVVEELTSIFAQAEGGPLAGAVRFLPIERLNAVLAISPQIAYLERAQTWVQRLDRGETGPGRRIYVYYLENARAGEIAAVLTQVFGGGQPQPIPVALAPGGVAAAVTTPGAAPIGAAPPTAQAAAPRGAPPQQQAQARPTTAAPTTAAQRGQPVVGTRTAPTPPRAAQPTPAGGDQIRIVADETTNALVILANDAEYRMIEATLRRLDILPLQVLIEATVAEVSLTDDLSYGLNWFFRSGNSSFTFSSLETGLISGQFPGFAYLLGAGADARVVLNALSEVTNVNVISSPQLMVLDNQSARLQVGDQVPIATQSATAVVDPDAPIVNQIQYQDTGVILEVTPRVSAGGLVVLDIRQEVSSVVKTETSTLNSPTIQQRQIQSTVAVHDGETVALGGLIRDDQTRGKFGLPFLSDLPILGNLFRTTTVNNGRTELLVLISPRVVRSRADAKSVTDELRRRLSSAETIDGRIGRR